MVSRRDANAKRRGYYSFVTVDGFHRLIPICEILSGGCILLFMASGMC
jgi:hypothetical protein